MNDGTKRVVVLALLVLALTSTAYLSVPMEIEDTNPATYVIVPLLMLPLFALFTIKIADSLKQMRPSLLSGTLLFLVFIILLFALRFLFSFEFVSMGLYLLLFPLAIASFVSLLFGLRNVSKFKSLMLYSVFSSPAVLVYLLKLDPLFAHANSLLIFSALHLFVKGVVFNAPITISTVSSSIGIGQACVSLGIFVALALFLIPVAYFYAGSFYRKLAWLVSGVALLVVLNLLRMLGIAYYWLAYGPSKTLIFIHEFIGSLLFYIAIIAMLLVAGKFELKIAKAKARKVHMKRGSKLGKSYALALCLSAAFAIVYILLSLNYAYAPRLPAVALASSTEFNFSNSSIGKQISSSLYGKGFKNLYVQLRQGIGVMVWNSTINSSNPIVLYLTSPSFVSTKDLLRNSTIKGYMYFSSTQGSTSELFDVISNKTEFFVLSVRTPFVFANSTSALASAYVIIPSYLVGSQKCAYSYAYTFAYNLFNKNMYDASESSRLEAAYCISSKIAG